MQKVEGSQENILEADKGLKLIESQRTPGTIRRLPRHNVQAYFERKLAELEARLEGHAIQDDNLFDRLELDNYSEPEGFRKITEVIDDWEETAQNLCEDLERVFQEYSRWFPSLRLVKST